MADAWSTYAFEFKGGLVSNLSPLQQGIQAPGSARVLKNFEPSIEGGYRRIEGFSKYDASIVPVFANGKVQGSGQSGTTLVVANMAAPPAAGNTFTIAGVTGTYTIAGGGVSYNSATKVATLTLASTLASSPADKAAVTFDNTSDLISGVATWNGTTVAIRNNSVYTSTGSGYTQINVPSYGTVLVNGAGQTGGTLAVDGLTDTPQVGDTFTVTGIEKVYTITAAVTVTSGAATLTISPNLASSPADNATITFLETDCTISGKARFTKYRIGSDEKIACATSSSNPFIYDGTSFAKINTNSDVTGAQHVTWFKNQLFFAKGDKLIFTSPYTDTDFNIANGSGVMNVGSEITGLRVFREQLIIFSEQRIQRLVGNTLADFVLQPITTNIGCVAEDTIQEIGGDLIFLGPDGLRLLSATDRIGDFNLAVVSKGIQKEMTDLIAASTNFCSTVIRKKSQYRIFGFSAAVSTENSSGIIGTQLIGGDTSGVAWAQLSGFKANVTDSDYYNSEEIVLFAQSDGYVYKMEDGSSFDGANILATFSTPYVPFNDPRIRKTFYKLHLYTDPSGSVTTDVNLKLDFDDLGSIQPDTVSLTNETGSVGFYGSPLAIFGVTTFGTKLKRVFESQIVGSGFSASLQFVSDGTSPPFSLDAATVEYSTHDRR